MKYQDDFKKGIIAAANHSGNSTTTAAITGNILGARLGFDAIGKEWVGVLELRDVLLELSDDLCHGCQICKYSFYTDEDWMRKYGESEPGGFEDDLEDIFDDEYDEDNDGFEDENDDEWHP